MARISYYKLPKSLFLYRNKSLIFKSESNKDLYKGNILLSLYDNPNFIVNLLKTNLIETKYFRGYYIVKRDILESAKKRKVQFDRVTKYKEILSQLPFIKYTKVRLDMYSGNNLVIDTYPYWNTFNTVYANRTTFNMRIPLFIPTLTEIINKISVYNSIIIPFIPIKQITTGREWSLENIIFFLTKNKLITDYSIFKNLHFLATSNSGNILFKFEITPDFNFIRYKRICNILSKLNTGIKLDASEKELLDVQSNESDTIEDNNDFEIKPLNTELEEPKINLATNNIVATKKEIINKTPEEKIITKKEVIKNSKSEKIEQVKRDYKKDIDNSFIDFDSNNLDIDEVVDSLVTDETLKDYDVNDVKNKIKVERLKERQSKVTFNFNGKETSLEQVLQQPSYKEIDTEKIPVNTLNEEVKTSKLGAFDKIYNNGQKERDFAKMITAFNNDKECPLYVTKITKTDTSTAFDKKETYNIRMMDVWGVQHSITVDLPVTIDNSFIYVNGGKKIIGKQLVQIPIIKTKPDEVCITTNYNKMYIYRVGQKASSNIERLKKYFETNQTFIKVTSGNNLASNKEYINTIEYDEISKFAIKIQVKDAVFSFDRSSIKEEIDDKTGLNIDKLDSINEFPLGYINSKNAKKIFTIDIKNDLINVYDSKLKLESNFDSIFNCILALVPEEIYNEIVNQSVPKRYMYTRTKLSGQWIPLIILMGFYFGLEKTLLRYNIQYEFSEKRRRLAGKEITTTSMIPFEDGYLYYDSSSLKNSILMNGLMEFPTKEVPFSSLNEYNGYFDFFENTYNSRNVSKGFKNNLDMLLDPKTIEVLQYLKLPDNLFDVLLYANTLLDDNSFTPINSIYNYRLRSGELVNDHLYKILAESFKTYKDEKKSGRKEAKIHVQKDAIIKSMLESPIIEDYSILSPIFEAEKLASTNYKGLAGTNLDSAFTKEMRLYDKTMTGLFGLFTPDSDKVGIVRTLSYNPKINNTLGIIDMDKPVSEMNGTDLFTTAELMTSYSTLHDDPPRVQMQSQQNRHIVPTMKQSRPLFGSGMEKTIPYNLSTDFVNIAKDDGVVEDVNEKLELVTVKYKDGTKDVIDISDKVSKNGNGGFFITNKKEMLLSKGQKFKKNDIIARNPNYFLGNKSSDIMYAKGLLTKIVVHSGDFTLEDSSIITQDLVDDMACEVTMMKKAIFGPNTNILSMVKKHQHIKAGEPLITFEHSFEDADANKALDALDDSFAEYIEGLGVDSITSKFTGEIVDIKIYFNVDESLFSKSIKSIIAEYRSDVEKKKKVLDKSDNVSTILPATEKINSARVKGIEMEGIMFEFYIRHLDKLKIGDKIAYECALKTIVCDVIPKGEEPYSEYRPDEPIKAILSPMSIISRMTTSIYNMLYTNKLIIEMKRKTKEIWES